MENNNRLALHDVQVQGDARNPTVVLCQNFGSTRMVWNSVVPFLLNRGYRVITYENMGSPRINRVFYDYHHYLLLGPFATDLNSILEELRVDSCIFVGHSLACMIGVVASIIKPHLFSKLVFINPTPKYLSDPHPDRSYIGCITGQMAERFFGVLHDNRVHALNDDLGLLSTVDAIQVPGLSPEGHTAIWELSRPFFFVDPLVAPHLVGNMLDNIDGRGFLTRVPRPCHIVQSQEDNVVPRPVTEFVIGALGNQLRRPVRYVQTNNHYPHMYNAAELANALVEELQR